MVAVMSGVSREMTPQEILRDLVAIPSVHPEMATDPDVAGEARMAAYLGAWFRRLGFAVELPETSPGRPNVIARFGPARPARTLMIEGHLDTQGIDGMTVPPFAAQVRDGRLFGRGACDMKGPMAAALWALDRPTADALAAAGIAVIFAGAIGEEKGNEGARQLVAGGLTADEAVVLEPTGLDVIHAHKGTFWFEVQVGGRASHGSRPREGVNAILGATDLAAELIRRTEALPRRHPLLGAPTLNPGLIRGGTAPNVVPDRCTVTFDRRVLPGESREEILADVRAAAEALREAGRIAGWSAHVVCDTPAVETAGDTPLVRRLLAAAAAEGAAARAGGSPWYSDAGPFAAACGSFCVFGPGGIAQAHTADEYILVSELDRGARILRRFLHLSAGAPS
jgi:acetylornithine deacetylase/succinyl-diaminopimelate desuccinylase-like protein